MALQALPGQPGFAYGLISSMSDKAIGKFTDSNHLAMMHVSDPADYDKKIIEIYTQTSLQSNDFLDMVNKSSVYEITGNTDSFQWEVEVPFQFAKVIEIPTDTANAARIGIDRQEFTLVLDTNEFAKHSIIGSDKMYGQQFYVVYDPIPHNSGYLYTLTLITTNPKTDFVNRRWIQVGTEYELMGGSIGEFDQDLLGVGRPGKKIPMFESLGSAIGFEHTITSWADSRQLKDPKTGNPLDLIWYTKQQRNQQGVTMKDIRWEPMVERIMREKMLSMKVEKMIWGQAGSASTNNSQQDVKKISSGVYQKMRSANLVQYNKGEFSPNIFRTIFGDLFYRRVNVADRKVRVYTNESGFETFNQAMKEDAFNSGFTFNIGDGNRFVQGQGQNLIMNYAFDGMVTRETGMITLKHLTELDLPQKSVSFGPNRKSPPLFLVFDVSPSSDGTLKDNIREIRRAGEPSGTWGYVDGRRSHLGFAASKGMQSSNMFPGYKIWMEDRYDVFIEDLSRTAIIEEIPQI